MTIFRRHEFDGLVIPLHKLKIYISWTTGQLRQVGLRTHFLLRDLLLDWIIAGHGVTDFYTMLDDEAQDDVAMWINGLEQEMKDVRWNELIFLTTFTDPPSSGDRHLDVKRHELFRLRSKIAIAIYNGQDLDGQ